LQSESIENALVTSFFLLTLNGTTMMTLQLAFVLGGLEILFGSLFGCIGLFGTVLWIWMLIDCATKETDQGNTKLIWILIIVFTHVLGALLYLLIRRPQGVRELGR
jgi:hypothetical protein